MLTVLKSNAIQLRTLSTQLHFLKLNDTKLKGF